MQKTLAFPFVSFVLLLAGCEWKVADDWQPPPDEYGNESWRRAPSPSASTSTSSSSTSSSEPRLPQSSSSDGSASSEEDASASTSDAGVPMPTQCEGTATSCSDLDIVTCDRQSGCVVDEYYECVGVATPCSALSRMWPCQEQWGCTWGSK